MRREEEGKEKKTDLRGGGEGREKMGREEEGKE